jgi:hypothetical protein
MRHSPELIARVIGQMDSDDENVRLIAFGKAHAMLKAAGLKFADLHASHVTAASKPTTNDDGPTKPRQAAPTRTRPEEVRVGAYLHEPRVRWWTRQVDGKRVIRNQGPPNHVYGRIRILKDEPTFSVTSEWRTLTLSFETGDALYEPFVMERSDPEWLALIRRKSEDGTPIRFV